MKSTVTSIFLALIAIVAMAIPLFAWWTSVGNPADYFVGYSPPGQKLYIFSKLAGLMAICVFWLQCLLALTKRLAGPAYRAAWSSRSHRLLGIVTFSLAFLHVALFFAAASVRAGKPAWGLFLPNFTQGYFNQSVSLGLIAFGVLCVGFFAGWKLASGRGRWRIGHYLWIIVFPLVFLHATAIGTESQMSLMLYFLVSMFATLLVIGVARFRGLFTLNQKGSAW
ncbi:hypothetical protein ACL7TT_17820 [Microbulbifer sp. 2304DJ12-6]|uniref:hypothetical protein n=1 Tax=Microbulbifer sp. 2304DJ12-6 TaxID=3233340 RepID=UPI0039B0F91C